jgi:Zn-dependent protease
MLKLQHGSLEIFRVAGIAVAVHWTWLIIAYLEVQDNVSHYKSKEWNVAELAAVFAVVLLHEFGHALACRSVGGRANQIVLWPLGGVATTQPPPRPGAYLWTVAAGPLVNVLLVPVTIALWQATGGKSFGIGIFAMPDNEKFFLVIMFINLSLLVINLLPIYPMDGGQILYALLWFVIGRAPALLVVSILGPLGGVLLLVWMAQEWGFGLWLLLPILILTQSLAGIQQARFLFRLNKMPRHKEFACPFCKEAPLKGPFWLCHQCQARFDTFDHLAVCPHCGLEYPETSCPLCGKGHPIRDWLPDSLATDHAGEETKLDEERY